MQSKTYCFGIDQSAFHSSSVYMFFSYKHMKFRNQARLCLAVSGFERKGGMHLGARALEAHQHTFSRRLKNEFLAEI